MKNNIDFTYVVSPLNRLDTRITIISGEYNGLMFDLEGSGVAITSGVEGGVFDVKYVIRKLPVIFDESTLEKREFKEYIANTSLCVIVDKNTPTII